MANPKIYFARISTDKDGKYILSGDTKDMEKDFEGAMYKSADGIETVGTPKVYTEEYPEEGVMDVYFPDEMVFKSTDFTLKVYFIPKKDISEQEPVAQINEAYNAMKDFLSGSLVMYWDNIRKRKVLVALTESVKPTTSSVKPGGEYYEVSFKFKNVFGRSFPLDDETLPIVTLNNVETT